LVSGDSCGQKAAKVWQKSFKMGLAVLRREN